MLVLTLLTVGSLAPLAWADWTVQGYAKALIAAVALTVLLIAGIAVTGHPRLLIFEALTVGAALLARHSFSPEGRMAIAVVIVGAGLPAWAFTMYYAMLTLPDILCGAGACLAI